MKFNVEVSTIFECTLERAFKTPMLCDVTKVHTGYGLMPRVTHATDDENWGQVGGSKKIYMAKSLSHKGGFASMDTVIEREENIYWIIQVDDFQSWMLSFYKFVGEWRTTAIKENKIQVNYSYALHAKNVLLFPLCWLFANSFYKVYMKRVLGNTKKMAYNKEPYLYK